MDGKEKELSIQLSSVNGICPHCELLFTGDEHCVSGCKVCTDQLKSFGYHRKCYGQFTDKPKVERARKRLAKGKPKAINPPNEALEYSADCTLETDILRPVLCSHISKSVCDDSRATSGKQHHQDINTDSEYRKRLNLFPLECCLSHSETKYTTDLSSRKEKKRV